MASLEEKLADWFVITAEVLQRPIVELPLADLSEEILRSFGGSMFTSNLRDGQGRVTVQGFGWRSSTPTSADASRAVDDLFKVMDLRLFDYHPLLRWYALSGQGAPQTTERVPKEWVTSWQTHEVRGVLRSFGVAHQLSIPLAVKGKEHQAVVVCRPAGPDFSEDDLRLARWLQPMLTALQRQAEMLATRAVPEELASALSGRELAVLRCVAEGMTAHAASAQLSVSPRTVEKHLENIYRKLGVTNRIAAIARLCGSDEPSLDLQERVQRYA
jgi:DNA-binding CsgD family transcriptional regulator